MTIYDVFTTWILLGLATYLDHVFYVWGSSSPYYRNEVTKLLFFLTFVIWFPILLFGTMEIRYEVWRDVLKYRKSLEVL
ncbi:hypothetical protein F546_04945 [Vibrio paracholerae 877-163]|nr:hypothetical protein F546_04945 [Vibrio paracholerae 877-163]